LYISNTAVKERGRGQPWGNDPWKILKLQIWDLNVMKWTTQTTQNIFLFLILHFSTKLRFQAFFMPFSLFSMFLHWTVSVSIQWRNRTKGNVWPVSLVLGHSASVEPSVMQCQAQTHSQINTMSYSWLIIILEAIMYCIGGTWGRYR